MLQSLGSKRVRHDSVTEQQQHDPITIFLIVLVLSSAGLFLPLCCVSCLEKFFSICRIAGLVVLNSLHFCLSGMLLISPSNLNASFARQSILGCGFFCFITLNISCHSLLACRVSVEKSADNLIRVPLCVAIFPLLLLIFCLCL